MEISTSSIFISLQNLQQYLKIHKTNFKLVFSEVALDSSVFSFDHYSLSDILNNFLLLKENLGHVLDLLCDYAPSYLDLEGLKQEQCLLIELTKQIQYHMKEDFKLFLKTMKKYCLSDDFGRVSLFTNSIFEEDLSGCLKNIKSLKEEMALMLDQSEEIKQKKKINEVFVKKTQEKFKFYTMMLDFWVNERTYSLEDSFLLGECQGFMSFFLDLSRKLDTEKIKLPKLKKELFIFFNGNIKSQIVSLKDIDCGPSKKMDLMQDPSVSSLQHHDTASDFNTFVRIKNQPIKLINTAESQEFTKILREKDNEGKLATYLTEITQQNEELIKVMVFSCNRIFEDISTQSLLKFNALSFIKKGVELAIPLFIKCVDASLVKSLAFFIFLVFSKEYVPPKSEEHILEELLRFGIECFFVWGKTFHQNKDYPNITLAFNFLLEKNIEFPTSLKFFEGRKAMPQEKQLFHKIMLEKNLLKEFLDNNLDDVDITEITSSLQKLEALLNSDQANIAESASIMKEKMLLKSIKLELDGFKKKKLKFMEFRSNVLKLIIKSKYEQESVSLSAKLPSIGAKKFILRNNSSILPPNLLSVEEKKESVSSTKIPSFQELIDEKDQKISNKFKQRGSILVKKSVFVEVTEESVHDIREEENESKIEKSKKASTRKI